MRSDSGERLARARLALEGLSLGDAFGQRFFGSPDTVEQAIAWRAFPRPPWRYTDDTEMAAGIVEVLERHGRIEQDALAQSFARRYRNAPHRGYGAATHETLRQIGEGVPWRTAASTAFGGTGSMGNGAAMRVAPVGAYFADDLPTVTEEARASAEVTHAHQEGKAGAIAVATAAAWACRNRGRARDPRELLEVVLDHTPDGDTRLGLAKAVALTFDLPVETAVSALGNGSRILCSDTVPFALWCAARHLDDFEEAMWTTVGGLGDRDTTCAIAGGIVVLFAGRESLPSDWMAAREPLND